MEFIRFLWSQFHSVVFHFFEVKVRIFEFVMSMIKSKDLGTLENPTIRNPNPYTIAFGQRKCKKTSEQRKETTMQNFNGSFYKSGPMLILT